MTEDEEGLWEDPGFADPEDEPPDADDLLAAAAILRRKVEAGEITPEQARAAAAKLGGGETAPARLSLDAPSLADEALSHGVGPALLVADEIRRKVRALAKKGYPPPS